MARTSKTKLGGKVATGEMLQAGKAQEGVVAAEAERGKFHERTLERTTRGAAAADTAIKYQTEKLAAERAEVVRVGESEAAEATRVSELAEKSQEEKRQFDVQEQRRTEELDLRAAQSGYQRTGGGEAPPGEPGAGAPGAPGAQEPQTEGQRRAAQTEEEMQAGTFQGAISPEAQAEQQRRSDQGAKGLEMPTARGAVQGAQGPWEQTPAAAKAAEYAGETERIKQEAERAEAIRAYNSALYGEDTSPEKLVESRKRLEKRVESAYNSWQEVKDAFGGGVLGRAGAAPLNWRKLQGTYSDVPDDAFQAELQAETVGPAMMRVFGNELALRGVETMAVTGEYPSNLDWVDTTNAMWRTIEDEVTRQNDKMRMFAMPAPADIATKMRTLHQLAATNMMLAKQQNPIAMRREREEQGRQGTAAGQGGGGAARVPSEGGPRPEPKTEDFLTPEYDYGSGPAPAQSGPGGPYRRGGSEDLRPTFPMGQADPSFGGREWPGYHGAEEQRGGEAIGPRVGGSGLPQRHVPERGPLVGTESEAERKARDEVDRERFEAMMRMVGRGT